MSWTIIHPLQEMIAYTKITKALIESRAADRGTTHLNFVAVPHGFDICRQMLRSILG